MVDQAPIFVVSGPGGVGKGTIVKALIERDPSLWLSRSWTTRERRDGEPEDAYVFTTRAEFEAHIDRGGFLEWTEFLDNYYGTPRPETTPGAAGRDLVLEIELDGAQQVKRQYPQAVLIFVMPPSRKEQRRRLVGRGDPDHKVQARLDKAEKEEPIGTKIADHVVVNDDVAVTVDEMLRIVHSHRVGSGSLPPG